MRAELVIADDREELLATWRDAFGGVSGVTIVHAPLGKLAERYAPDAEVLPGIYVHERFGGRPQHRVSQVIATNEAGVRWMVTTPPEILGEDFAVPPGALSAEQQFATIFRAVRSFNEAEGGMPIRRVGMHLTILNAPQGDPRSEAKAASRAYVQVFGSDASD